MNAVFQRHVFDTILYATYIACPIKYYARYDPLIPALTTREYLNQKYIRQKSILSY